MSDRLPGCGILALAAAASILLGPARLPAQAPDLVLTGGKVFTADPARPWAEAIAVRGDRIIAVGSDADVAKLAARATRRIELGGRVVVPGFNDAHAHLGCHAISSPNPAAIALATISDEPFPDPPFAPVADSLRALAARLPAGHWIGANIGLTVLEDTAARRVALDGIAPEHPVWLGAWTGHGVILNSRALHTLGIDDATADPSGGRYEREPGSRRLTGLLEEYAVMQARRRLCSMQPESVLVASFRTEGQQFPLFGITSVQNMAGELEPALFMRVASAAEVPVRLRMISFPIASAAGNVPDDWRAERLPGAPARNSAGGTVTASGVKWILDGTPIERLAAHRRPYRDRPGHFGRLNFPPDTIRALLLEARARREQPLLHAGGDSTLAVVLDLMERHGGSDWAAVRVRLEHGDGLAPDLLARARPARSGSRPEPIAPGDAGFHRAVRARSPGRLLSAPIRHRCRGAARPGLGWADQSLSEHPLRDHAPGEAGGSAHPRAGGDGVHARVGIRGVRRGREGNARSRDAGRPRRALTGHISSCRRRRSLLPPAS
jgi:predicted amidohydrolase YtcJ